MDKVIAVVLECQGGKIVPLSWEALAAAQELGTIVGASVDAVVIGADSDAPVTEASHRNVRQVVNVAGAFLQKYTPDGFSLALRDALEQLKPQYVLFPHSYQVREFVPKLAEKMGRPFLSDCTGLRAEGAEVVFSRQLYQGKLYADLSFEGEGPYFVSVQAGSFRAAEPRSETAPVIRFDSPDYTDKIRTRPLERLQESKRTVDLSASDFIVAVGRGIKEAENLGLVEQLANALGGQVAGSRPICDNGWLPMDRQVGSSGQMVAPKLYFAIGISGAIQHVVGMKSSRKIVAINKDANAPIFEVADIGIIANLFDVVPAITSEILAAKQSAGAGA